MIEVIYIALFSVWFTFWFSPIQGLKNDFIDAYINYCVRKGLPQLSGLAVVLTCPKCFSFWFTLLYKQDFFLALGVSFVTYLITFVIKQIEHEYEKH